MIETARSIKGIPIRLTYERWYHIIENHDELAGRFHDVLDAIERPHFVCAGNKGTLKAVVNVNRDRWLCVLYRELSKKDGFVITAYYLESKPKGKIIWQRQ